MENQAMRRRMNMIVAHFATDEDVSAAQILPLNCSSTINSVVRRGDNRLSFARQGSSSQANFMKPVPIKENFTRSNSYQSQLPPRSPGSANKNCSCNVPGASFVSRAVQMKPEPNTAEQHSPVSRECQLSMEEPPKFSRPYKGREGKRQNFSETIAADGRKWSPRMDVVESGRYYIVTVELPGVTVNNTRVEVDGTNLVVTGKRTTQWWRGARGSEDLMTTYQKREILQGPYKVVWPLPSNVYQDRISAEFVDGFLGIIVPKILK